MSNLKFWFAEGPIAVPQNAVDFCAAREANLMNKFKTVIRAAQDAGSRDCKYRYEDDDKTYVNQVAAKLEDIGYSVLVTDSMAIISWYFD